MAARTLAEQTVKERFQNNSQRDALNSVHVLFPIELYGWCEAVCQAPASRRRKSVWNNNVWRQIQGTVFKITTAGQLATLYSFCQLAACADGKTPLGTLIQATDGNFYGTTFLGGANGFGTIFELKPTGTLTTLHSFCATSGCPDGANPIAGLMQDTNGEFYGTAVDGGSTAFNCDGAGTAGQHLDAERSSDYQWACTRSSHC